MTAGSVESIISGTRTLRLRRSRKAAMSFLLVDLGVLQADVDDLSALAHLGAAHLGGAIEVVVRDEAFEGSAAEHVGALPDKQGAVLFVELDGLQAGDECSAMGWDWAWPLAIDE